jgi:hypothetical protein
MYQMANQIAPQINKMNLSASDGLNSRLRYERMIKELASANCPVLAVNVEGLSSRFKEPEFQEAFPRLRPEANPTLFIDRRGEGDSSLMEMAKISGGEYFGGMNDYKQIASKIQA